jgi:steroid 5-alpha reductase family enzyme
MTECFAPPRQANRHAFITTGMWRYSRHPNYFGELLMWLAVASSVAAAGWRQPGGTLLGRYQLAWLSPAFTATLLLGVSGLPMVEAAGRKKWGGQTEYEHYMANTSSIAPWFPAPTVRSSAGAGPSGGLGAKEKKCVR